MPAQSGDAASAEPAFRSRLPETKMAGRRMRRAPSSGGQRAEQYSVLNYTELVCSRTELFGAVQWRPGGASEGGSAARAWIRRLQLEPPTVTALAAGPHRAHGRGPRGSTERRHRARTPPGGPMPPALRSAIRAHKGGAILEREKDPLPCSARPSRQGDTGCLSLCYTAPGLTLSRRVVAPWPLSHVTTAATPDRVEGISRAFLPPLLPPSTRSIEGRTLACAAQSEITW